MRVSDKTLAYVLLRVALGVNFVGHGLTRIHHGVGAFAASTAQHLAQAPLPHLWVLGFSYAIPWVEAVLGVLLIAGLVTRWALAGGAVFMMVLTAGVTANQQWDIAGQQLLYSLIFFLLLFFHEWNAFSLDRLAGLEERTAV